MEPATGHIHCSTHVGGHRNAEEIAEWTQDHETSLILGSLTAAQSGLFLVQFNLICIGRAAPEEGRIRNNCSPSLDCDVISQRSLFQSAAQNDRGCEFVPSTSEP